MCPCGVTCLPKDWLAWNQDNVAEWSYMSTRGFKVFYNRRYFLNCTQVSDKRKCGIVSSFIVDNHWLFFSHYSAKNQIFTSNLKMATIRKKKKNSKLCNQIWFGLWCLTPLSTIYNQWLSTMKDETIPHFLLSDTWVHSSPSLLKPKTIKCVFASPLSTQLSGAKTGWLGIRIMCPCGVTCLPLMFCSLWSTLFGPQNARFQELPPPEPLTALSLMFLGTS
jgi:hypothetical protein